MCACAVSSYFPRGSSHDWLAFCWLEERTGKDRSQSFKALNENTWRETEEGSEWNRKRERDWLNPAQWKKGSTFTPFRGLTGKERNTQSDIISVTSRLLGFQWNTKTCPAQSYDEIPARRNWRNSRGEMLLICSHVCVNVFVAIWSESLVYRVTLVSLPLNRLCCSLLNPVL